MERVEAVRFSGPDGFTKCELMSPYVWRQLDGTFGVLVRAVPGGGAGGASTGSIWYGRSYDGLLFDIDNAPVLSPDTGCLDANGCEDPTVVLHGGELIVFLIVFYTGVDGDGDGHLLWTSGADLRALEKRGVAARSFRGERDIKEAEVAVRDGR